MGKGYTQARYSAPKSSLPHADHATVYQQAVAGADGAKALADAQATDDYVDEVYGAGGDYQTWQDSLGAAENAYELAENGARETLNRNLAAHDTVLRAGLADTFADAMEPETSVVTGTGMVSRSVRTEPIGTPSSARRISRQVGSG